MKKATLNLFRTSMVLSAMVTITCSHTARKGISAATAYYEATTPCNEISKSLFSIAPEYPCEMMKWKLALHRDPNTLSPTTFNLSCEYGMPKQGTRGFTDPVKKIELKGQWTIQKGTKENAKGQVYQLTSEDPAITISFLNLDDNLLHLLDNDKMLMNGNGAWSFTLNRTIPVSHSSNISSNQIVNQLPLITDSVEFGTFDGRIPCNKDLLDIHDIPDEGCQLVKCRLTLFQDPVSHAPTYFNLYTIYVGKGDKRYLASGKWSMTRGTKKDPEAIFYLLETETGKKSLTLALQKAGDHILFFLDGDWNFLVGNNYSSFTLNRK